MAAYEVLLRQDYPEAFSDAVQRQWESLNSAAEWPASRDFVAQLFGVLVT
jgi:hypothetical protein